MLGWLLLRHERDLPAGVAAEIRSTPVPAGSVCQPQLDLLDLLVDAARAIAVPDLVLLAQDMRWLPSPDDDERCSCSGCEPALIEAR